MTYGMYIVAGILLVGVGWLAYWLYKHGKGVQRLEIENDAFKTKEEREREARGRWAKARDRLVRSRRAARRMLHDIIEAAKDGGSGKPSP